MNQDDVDSLFDVSKPLKVWCGSCNNWHYFNDDPDELDRMTDLGCVIKWKSIQRNKDGR